MAEGRFRDAIRRGLRWSGLFLFALALPGGPAAAQVAPTPDGFTSQVAATINAGRPDNPVRIVSPLTLEGRTATGRRVQMNLDRIYALCRADQARCPATLATYVGQAEATLRQPEGPAPTQAGLRLAVRPQGYAQNLASTLGGPVPASSQSLPPGLLALVYLDGPAVMRLMAAGDLQALHVAEGQAFATALRNTARVLQPLDQMAPPLPPGEVGGFRGTAYESSRLLFPADWGRLAAQFGGHLLVAVPSAEEVLYANGSGTGALARIAAAARARFDRADRPTSAEVYEWRPDGWVLAR